ncbi:DEAD/DEAH box helicase [Carpediemonas membranifera]|uniref:DEAD/DEAH box helicase n=1 Tax=Carpediemonas membranifera TaxID=201153 RepID=A0A8J6BV01_9EUKA|nr:DEAD/DEAH box helicase [Carpediemonas membranifera]|eukprot:KAG9390906.1 DEAD/DEAH box helicase [Carpediemonas membranifera]
MDFKTLGVAKALARRCEAMGIESPTEIQKLCIPAMLSGKRVLGIAETGSGKTLSFTLPMLTELQKDPYGIFGLILTPTRELAIQIEEHITAIGYPFKVSVATVIGRTDMTEQSREIDKRPHFIVATPGRLASMIQSPHISTCFKHCRYLILDEADRLLSDDFSEDFNTILDHLPPKDQRETHFFTATKTELLENLAKQSDMTVCDCSGSESIKLPSTLSHSRIDMARHHARYANLVQLLLDPVEADKQAIVFANSCLEVETVCRVLRELGFPATQLHGNLPQRTRTSNLNSFRSAKNKVLVATDVAARGLDIPNVAMVVNFDLPPTSRASDYIHRVGRTARIGMLGTAVTLLKTQDREVMDLIEEMIGRPVEALAGKALAEHEEKVIELLPKVTAAMADVKRRMLEGGQAEEMDRLTARRGVKRAGKKRD